MKKVMLIVVSAAALVGCGPDPVHTGTARDNPGFVVETLGDYDGCRFYRADGYTFMRCNGAMTQGSESHYDPATETMQTNQTGSDSR